MIGRLLDISKVETTARYARLAQDSMQDSAARVAESIEASVSVDGKVAERDVTDRSGGLARACFLPSFRTLIAFRRTSGIRAEARVAIKREFWPVFRVIPVEGRVMDAWRGTARAMS